MPTRYTLAAVLRTTRAARGLSQEHLATTVDARHLHRVEHAKSNISLEMLEDISKRLDVDSVALLAAAACYERKESLEEFMTHLWTELSKLREMRVMENLPAQFSNGVLIAAKSGKPPTPPDRIKAILDCKADGLSQKETSVKLGMPYSTVHKFWHMPAGEQKA
ncbi:helix-turn-helix domain-containing protein [Pseudomonas fulva]|uniref:helix-turn-helix domain-containing protein n=1 Tax=Pseudomonas fulva TaxID=47880 RepID=UPI00200B52FB|nr:helix-turn-helix transcriptional regulator [Pseudomonas fulva]